VALAALGRWKTAQTLLRHAPDPTVRSFLIDRLGPGGADAAGLLALLTTDSDISVRRAALLALGSFDQDRLPLPQRERFLTQIVDLYQGDPDPGIHAAAGWLLRQWGLNDRLKEIDHAAATGKPEGSRRWYLTTQGVTMVLLPPGDVRRGIQKQSVIYHVDHGLAIADREVTVAEFRRFRKDYNPGQSFARSDDCPAHIVSWFDAAAYCNWLSEKEGISKEQWCYSPDKHGEYGPGMSDAPDIINRTGYRMPTADEWEYACRAGSVTRWSHGEAEDLLSEYAWCVTNSWSRLHPVATLRPNDLGLFDMHGNAWEWCQGPAPKMQALPGQRPIRGGAFGHGPLTIQSANEMITSDAESSGDVGFRPVRTLR
jgi:formylglycine-generating enzyme required for sulfatase activity